MAETTVARRVHLCLIKDNRQGERKNCYQKSRNSLEDIQRNNQDQRNQHPQVGIQSRRRTRNKIPPHRSVSTMMTRQMWHAKDSCTRQSMTEGVLQQRPEWVPRTSDEQWNVAHCGDLVDIVKFYNVDDLWRRPEDVHVVVVNIFTKTTLPPINYFQNVKLYLSIFWRREATLPGVSEEISGYTQGPVEI